MKSIMIQGTSSHAGKSVLVAAILRFLKNRGISCAPFKPQNMALNSFVTYDGYEIGRAQAMQAESAKIAPSKEMNPILLKPSTDSKAQVVVLGKPWKNLSAKEYVRVKSKLKSVVKESFEYLVSKYDVIVVEGAGSPAEINLRKNDIANMGFAKLYNIPVLIVGDIDRGGVYASFYGTYALLTRKERDLLKGFVINKFRGDESLLNTANEFIERKTGKPVIGVIPFFKDIEIPEEDGVALTVKKSFEKEATENTIRIRVIRLPRISNFTDFDPLFGEKEVDIKYVSSPKDAMDAHVVIIPGSKNTIEDLIFLKDSGFEEFLRDFVKKGGFLVGICGGYQMLGEWVEDPYNVESNISKIKALSFLPLQTVMGKEKQLRQVLFETIDGNSRNMNGYEIHMGVTKCKDFSPVFKVFFNNEYTYDGYTAQNGKVWGSYIHGLFDNDEFRIKWLNSIRRSLGMSEVESNFSYGKSKERAYDKLAELFAQSVDIDKFLSILGI
ncbi:MAG: cobyric acid synthase [Proteobacteria bacterium]|nr:cobyric acid synthase [Pseudomonadota bacterium]